MAWGTRHSRYSGVVDFNRFRFTRLAIAEAFHLTNRYALRMTFTVKSVTPARRLGFECICVAPSAGYSEPANHSVASIKVRPARDVLSRKELAM